MSDDFWDCHTHVFGPADTFPLTSTVHYAPPVRSIDELEAEGARVGVGHVVLVQPSVYGNDHRCLLEALRARGDRHRAGAGVPPNGAEAGVAGLHTAAPGGVRVTLSA